MRFRPLLKELTRPVLNDAESRLRQAGYEQLNTGSFSHVWARPGDDFVLKLFTPRDTAYQTFLQFCMANPGNEHLPRMRGKPMRVSDEYMAVRLERLDPAPTTWRNVALACQRTLGGMPLVTPEQERAGMLFPGLIAVAKQLRRLTKPGYRPDVHLGNLMARGTKPVLIDPWETEGTQNVVKRTPMGMIEARTPPQIVMPAGTRVYHGTNTEWDETTETPRGPSGPVWVTNARSIAQWFANTYVSDYHGQRGTPRVIEYVTTRPLRMFHMTPLRLSRLEGLCGFERGQGDLHYMADEIVSRGFDGWIGTNGDYDWGGETGKDIMIADGTLLRYVRTLRNDRVTEKTDPHARFKPLARDFMEAFGQNAI